MMRIASGEKVWESTRRDMSVAWLVLVWSFGQNKSFAYQFGQLIFKAALINVSAGLRPDTAPLAAKASSKAVLGK